MAPVMFQRPSPYHVARSTPSCWLEPEILAVPRGGSSWAALHLSSDAGRPCSFRLGLEGPAGWVLDTPATVVEVGPGQESVLFLHVQAPGSEQVGARSDIVVHVDAAQSPRRSLRITAHVVSGRDADAADRTLD